MELGQDTPKSKVPFPLAGCQVVSPARRNALALGKHASLSFELKPPATSAAGIKPLVFSASSTRALQQWLIALHAATAGGQGTPAGGSAHGGTPAYTPAWAGGAMAGSLRTSGADPDDTRDFDVTGRQPRTRQEAAHAAALEEWALLGEELERMRAKPTGEGEGSAEADAVLRLLDGLKPFVPTHRRSEFKQIEALLKSRSRAPSMSHQSSLVSGKI